MLSQNPTQKTKKENLDSEDGFTDIIKIVIVTLLELVEIFHLLKKIKNGLEKLKQFLNKHGKNKTSTENSAPREIEIN